MSRNYLLISLMMINAGAFAAPVPLPSIKEELIREFGKCELYQPVTKDKFENLPNEPVEYFTRTCYKCPSEVAIEFVEEFTEKQTLRARQSFYVAHDNALMKKVLPISDAFLSKQACKKDKTEKTKLFVVDRYTCPSFTVKRSQGEENQVKMFTLEVTQKK